MYLLDTNICIHLLNERDAELERRFRAHSPGEIALCSVVKAELLFGARNSRRVEANLHRLHRFFEPLASLPFDDLAAEEYGRIRGELNATGTPLGPNDLLIAATAQGHDAILITRNRDEFGRVQGLRMETW